MRDIIHDRATGSPRGDGAKVDPDPQGATGHHSEDDVASVVGLFQNTAGHEDEASGQRVHFLRPAMKSTPLRYAFKLVLPQQT